uniref:Uncharacterized protein n=1 Tax=Anguilla anguilla TaxID=7936 RepID=A0A0E9STA3_ANGAN
MAFDGNDLVLNGRSHTPGVGGRGLLLFSNPGVITVTLKLSRTPKSLNP